MLRLLAVIRAILASRKMELNPVDKIAHPVAGIL